MLINLLPPLHFLKDLLRPRVLRQKKSEWIYFARARDGLFSILRLLNFRNGRVVLIPTSLCEEAIKPYLAAGLRPVAYKIDDKLGVDYADLFYCLELYDVAIFHGVEYFGWKQDFSRLFDELNRKDILLVCDKAHCMFDPNNSKTIPVNKWIELYSVKKFFPLPDGAVLLTNQCSIQTRREMLNMTLIKNLLSLFVRSAGINKLLPTCANPSNFFSNERVMTINEDTILLELDRGMSFIGNIIFSRIDFLKAGKKRQKNAQRLMLSVKKSPWATPFFSKISNLDIPYQFPIKVNDINAAVKHLCWHGIQVEQSINLPLDSAIERRDDSNVGRNIEHLHQQVLSIPVHHRLTEIDMQTICAAIEADL